jgi:hypothetical protein
MSATQKFIRAHGRPHDSNAICGSGRSFDFRSPFRIFACGHADSDASPPSSHAHAHAHADPCLPADAYADVETVSIGDVAHASHRGTRLRIAAYHRFAVPFSCHKPQCGRAGKVRRLSAAEIAEIRSATRSIRMPWPPIAAIPRQVLKQLAHIDISPVLLG